MLALLSYNLNKCRMAPIAVALASALLLLLMLNSSAELLRSESHEAGSRTTFGVLSARKVLSSSGAERHLCGSFRCAIEKDRRNRLDEMKDRTLAGLGLMRPPNTTGIHLPKSLVKRIIAESQQQSATTEGRQLLERRQRYATKAVIRKQYKFTQKGKLSSLPSALEYALRP